MFSAICRKALLGIGDAEPSGRAGSRYRRVGCARDDPPFRQGQGPRLAVVHGKRPSTRWSARGSALTSAHAIASAAGPPVLRPQRIVGDVGPTPLATEHRGATARGRTDLWPSVAPTNAEGRLRRAPCRRWIPSCRTENRAQGRARRFDECERREVSESAGRDALQDPVLRRLWAGGGSKAVRVAVVRAPRRSQPAAWVFALGGLRVVTLPCGATGLDSPGRTAGWRHDPARYYSARRATSGSTRIAGPQWRSG
jgi:hypothetical protein